LEIKLKNEIPTGESTNNFADVLIYELKHLLQEKCPK